MGTTRRHFLGTAALAASAAAAPAPRKRSPNDTIQFALIGAGGMGMGDARAALGLGGTQIVGVADLYSGRLERAKEFWGGQLRATRDYRELLALPEVDAVIVATPDHWHARIAIDALEAGKDVYLQKPMVQSLDDGPPLIEAARKSDRILQIGSQYVSSLIYQKVRELIRAGAIGELNMVESWLDRNTALGAWQYSIPTNASPQTVDWDRFLGRAPKIPFDATRFFRWRNYRDYGTGVAGDLFVHILSGLHFSTGAIGPSQVFASGGLRYWKDGREVPDVLLAQYEYLASPEHPEFTLVMRVNFKSPAPLGEFGFRFIGSEGQIVAGSTVKLTRLPKERAPGYTIDTFDSAQQKAWLVKYRIEYPEAAAAAAALASTAEEEFLPPRGYSAHIDHHKVFWDAVRNRQPVLEDAVFGFRTGGAALLSNISYFEQRVCRWDPKTMQLVA
jgi:predicted dehydrogenase